MDESNNMGVTAEEQGFRVTNIHRHGIHGRQLDNGHLDIVKGLPGPSVVGGV